MNSASPSLDIWPRPILDDSIPAPRVAQAVVAPSVPAFATATPPIPALPDGVAGGTEYAVTLPRSRSRIVRPALGRMVAFHRFQTKGRSTISATPRGARLWQRDYWEHVIRNEAGYRRAITDRARRMRPGGRTISFILTSRPIHSTGGEPPRPAESLTGARVVASRHYSPGNKPAVLRIPRTSVRRSPSSGKRGSRGGPPL